MEKGKTSRSQEINDNRLHKELGSSDRTGKPVKLCKDDRVMQVHDRTEKPVESSTHTVQEFGSPEHRDTASSNANKFNLAINEKNIDFNISGGPNAMVKRSLGINVHNLIQQVENHPQWTDLQAKTTVILPQKKKFMYIVAIGGSVRNWWIPIRCRQSIDLTSGKRCRHCTASRKRRTMRTMKIGRTGPPHGGNETSPQRWT